MPTRIPNKIHFVWVGNLLPHHQASNLARWAIENPRYDGVWLWTNQERIEESSVLLKKILEIDQRVSSVTKSCNQGNKYRVDLLINKGFFHRNSHVFIRSITSLTPLKGSKEYLDKALGVWKNYGMASDILRIWVLHQEGGIYMDFDTYSTGGSLSTGIRAPRDILFGQWNYKEKGVNGKLVNAVIAASQSSDELKSLAGFMKSKLDDITGNSFVVESLPKVPTIRKNIEAKKGELKTLQAELRDILVPITLVATGPEMLALWLESKGITSEVDEKALPYSFQSNAGYELRIESENTWLK